MTAIACFFCDAPLSGVPPVLKNLDPPLNSNFDSPHQVGRRKLYSRDKTHVNGIPNIHKDSFTIKNKNNEVITTLRCIAH
jgi:hypothetical protein